MFSVVELMMFPVSQYPDLCKVELFPTYEKAIDRANSLLKEFLETFGEDYSVKASVKKPLAIASNGEVNWWAYIKEIQNNIDE